MNARRGSPLTNADYPTQPEDSAWLEQEMAEDVPMPAMPRGARAIEYVTDTHGPGSGCDCGNCDA